MRLHACRPNVAIGPRTRLGRISLLTLGAAIALYTLSIALGPRGREFFDQPWWAIATICWVAATLASFATSVAAVVRQGERSIFTIMTALLLAVPVGFIVFELTVPHSG